MEEPLGTAGRIAEDINAGGQCGQHMAKLTFDCFQTVSLKFKTLNTARCIFDDSNARYHIASNIISLNRYGSQKYHMLILFDARTAFGGQTKIVFLA